MDAPISLSRLAMPQVAAEMRFEAKTWEEVAQRVGRSARTCRRWPLLHPREWIRCHAHLLRAYILASHREALAHIKRHMRSQNAPVSAAAARHWDKQCVDAINRLEALERGAIDPETQEALAVLAYTKGMNNAQLLEHLERTAERLRARIGGGGAATAAEPAAGCQ